MFGLGKSVSFKFVLQVITDAKHRVRKKINLSRALRKESAYCLNQLIITFSNFFLRKVREILTGTCSDERVGKSLIKIWSFRSKLLRFT